MGGSGVSCDDKLRPPCLVVGVCPGNILLGSRGTVLEPPCMLVFRWGEGVDRVPVDDEEASDLDRGL